MRDAAEVAAFLQAARGWLAPSAAATVVLSDVIPQTYSPARDALESLWFATRHGFFWPMLAHLSKAATKSKDHVLLRLAPDSLGGLARASGFSCRVLVDNLTPSKRRYSCRLSLA
jgi:hypothetical protein